MSKKISRKNNCSSRLERLIRLRKMNAPKWIIKSEQIALAANRKGLKYSPLNPSKYVGELQEKYVTPLLGIN